MVGLLVLQRAAACVPKQRKAGSSKALTQGVACLAVHQSVVRILLPGAQPASHRNQQLQVHLLSGHYDDWLTHRYCRVITCSASGICAAHR